MPLLDSFKVDHTRMNAPAVRVAKTMTTPKGVPWYEYHALVEYLYLDGRSVSQTR